MNLELSHFEIRTRDLASMEDFYVRALGMVVTDRGAGMVFLSANPGEHHQVVLNASEGGAFAAGSLDHLAFRLADLSTLRRRHRSVAEHGGREVATVSHGTSWSVYFRDPEGNRLELFVDTPWHVAQPLRFAIDLDMSDEELIAWTERQIAELADFQPAPGWFDALARRLDDD